MNSPSECRVINLAEKFARIERYWTPGIIGELNGQHVKLAKVKGAFDWHRHEHEDELFLVVEGRLEVQFRDRSEYVAPGEILVVPRGVEHRPVADQETHILLFEPASTRNTGERATERTVDPEWI